MSDAERVEPMVAVRGVTREFSGGVQALTGMDLTVESGETVAITGPSGCGKSTLLHLLAAIDTPTTGTLTVAGHRLDELSDPSAFRRNDIGLVFQFHNLLPHLSAWANVELPMFGTAHSAWERRERAEELLGELDLGELGSRFPTELSGGERQRVAIARALANRPKVLLADEPTGSLDTRSTARFLSILDDLGARGITIILVTHSPEVAAHADRIVEMSDGRIA